MGEATENAAGQPKATVPPISRQTDTQPQRQLIDAVVSAIGRGNSDEDWKVTPSEHAKLYLNTAPGLARLLSSERCTEAGQRYEDANTEAVKARDEFKTTSRRADTATFFAAAFGALLVATGIFDKYLKENSPWVLGIIGFAGVIAASLATMHLARLKSRNLAQAWAKTRAKAEARRLAYFKAVMLEAEPSPQAQLHAMEYVRRFLLDNQLDYFRGRSRQHRESAATAIDASTSALFVATTITGVASLFSWKIPELSSLAALGAIATAYAAMRKSQSATDQDQRNAERYALSEDALSTRKLELGDYRRRVASGESAVQGFFEPIFVALEADHKSFLEDAERRQVAIGNMEKRLDEAQRTLQKQPST